MTESTPIKVNAYTSDGDWFKVIINDEEQYSIWPEQKETLAGWFDVGFTGSKTDVSKYIDDHWTDMRPLSLRQSIAEKTH
jgi:MbtH protein